MFRSEINAGLLKSSVDTVSVLVDECKVRLDGDGLSIKAVDPANVGMVELDIPADSFESTRRTTNSSVSTSSVSRTSSVWRTKATR